jgi:hypothetical protein
MQIKKSYDQLIESLLLTDPNGIVTLCYVSGAKDDSREWRYLTREQGSG